MATKIPWTDETWNPVVGCTPVSEGCRNCYAARFASRGLRPEHRGLAQDGRWTGEVRCLPERLDVPLHWRKPRRVFVCSMSDLFHEKVPDGFIDQVFAVMGACPQHTFQVLTKRPERMAVYVRGLNSRHTLDGNFQLSPQAALAKVRMPAHKSVTTLYRELSDLLVAPWPLPNVWPGVTVENQAAADERIPLLLQTPAAVRFVSCEPLLEHVSFSWLNPRIKVGRNDHLDGLRALDWVIVGGESGPGARPCHVNWIRSIRDQCRRAGVACFIKQLGSKPLGPRVDGHPDAVLGEWPLKSRAGADPAEWPADLRVREYPKERT